MRTLRLIWTSMAGAVGIWWCLNLVFRRAHPAAAGAPAMSYALAALVVCYDGVAWWWYPGGYRVNERSDFGIINPDGTDRPVTKVIREFGPKLKHFMISVHARTSAS